MHIIKVKFLKADAPAGKPYTYYSPVAVAVGDKVQINAAAVCIVVAVDVPEAEVAPYRDKLKTIIGLVEAQPEHSGEKIAYAPPKTYDSLAATVAQSKYCREHGVSHVAPKSGRCWCCEQNIYLPGRQAFGKYCTDRDSAGISVERAGREHITGCPHCNRSFCG